MPQQVGSPHWTHGGTTGQDLQAVRRPSGSTLGRHARGLGDSTTGNKSKDEMRYSDLRHLPKQVVWLDPGQSPRQGCCM